MGIELFACILSSELLDKGKTFNPVSKILKWQRESICFLILSVLKIYHLSCSEGIIKSQIAQSQKTDVIIILQLLQASAEAGVGEDM